MFQDYPVSSLNASRIPTQLTMKDPDSVPPSAIGTHGRKQTPSEKGADNAIGQQLKELQDQYTLL